MSGKIRRMLPHLVILICNMYLVFFLIDRVNTAMNFIDNNLTKGLILALCAAGISNAMYLMRARRRSAAPRRSGGDSRDYAPRYGRDYGGGRGYRETGRDYGASGRGYRETGRDYEGGRDRYARRADPRDDRRY